MLSSPTVRVDDDKVESNFETFEDINPNNRGFRPALQTFKISLARRENDRILESEEGKMAPFIFGSSSIVEIAMDVICMEGAVE